MKANCWSRASARKAHSLLEILLILVIVAVVLGFVFGRPLIGNARTARIRSTTIHMLGYKGALQDFKLHALRYPTTEEGLRALVLKPAGLSADHWRGPYMEGTDLFADAFKTDFKYVFPSEHGNDYDLISAGPDKKFGTDDDISLFEEAPRSS